MHLVIIRNIKIHNSPFETNLDQCAANYAALTPISFLERSAFVYPDRTATVNGLVRRTWSETFARCKQLASALNKAGVKKGDATTNNP
ncbi:AMP-binding protein [Marinobacterium sp. xm-d-509]|uniref:AMP-binding protein n=1 Tax=Marinobacterium sp. xm-d-509 TaxID=2497739 RepID=UPI00352E0CA3